MMKRCPFTLLIHVALAIIVAGAFITHFFGIQGEVTLPVGGEPTAKFVKSSGPGDATFPFALALKSVDIDFYPGTTTPMDYRSHLLVDGKGVEVSMNNVGEVDGWRLYQSGISLDDSTLSVSYDPWGIAVTYGGYLLLAVGMAGYLSQRRTPWRALMRRVKRVVPLLALFMAAPASASSDEGQLPAMQRPLANNLGKAYVYWNDRICPLQTMAHDVTLKLYGAGSYRGLTPEQVLSGWLFYFDAWERDYNSSHEPVYASQPGTRLAKQEKAELERRALVRWLGTGEAFKVYPYKAATGRTEWLSLTGRRPSQMPLEQWKFMQTTMARMKSLLLQGKNIEANALIDTLIAGQREYAGVDSLPSPAKMQAERLFNNWARPAIAAVVSLLAGVLYLWLALCNVRWRRRLRLCLNLLSMAILLYLCAVMGVLWWISGHLPLSNGPETMMFMGLAALAGTVASRNATVRGSLLIVGALSLSVAAMGGRTPRIAMLMPVLASPLLSVHVMLVMASYVLFMLMAILSVVGLCSRRKERAEELCRLNRIILLPAVFLLAAGIFIGAVWANQSWGRYWGWDPKETCALVMLLVYSLPLHWGCRGMACFRKPKVLHAYLLAAVLTVAFTYFGANYLLTGLHSYA